MTRLNDARGNNRTADIIGLLCQAEAAAVDGDAKAAMVARWMFSLLAERVAGRCDDTFQDSSHGDA